jgi:methionyl-tRNA synthetase
MENKYFSTAIPYVNGQPHLGHALEFIQVDALARFWRQKNNDASVFSLTGTDENSLKNVRAAEEAGEEISHFVERHSDKFKQLATSLNCEFNNFIRTRDQKHLDGARKLWSKCNPDDIYKQQYSGLYCVGCEAFYSEDESDNGKCKIHKKQLEEVNEENYFFKLSNYQDELYKLISEDEIKIVPESRKNEMLSFINGGLQDFSISRSSERAKNWGVTVPNDDNQIMYVWFDALSNYITGLDYANEGNDFKKFWQLESAERTHVIGKDILRFHAIYWPAMLLSAKENLPTNIFVHGFFTMNGEKMSKSLGNVIAPDEIISKIGIDATRYYLLREMPYADDGDISIERLKVRYNELANQWGNLASRVSAMSVNYFEGQLDTIDVDSSREERLQNLLENYQIKDYIDQIFTYIGQANELVEKEAPFKTVKVDPDSAKLTLSKLASEIRWLAKMLSPIMPESSQKIIEAFSNYITKLAPLFPRLDD